MHADPSAAAYACPHMQALHDERHGQHSAMHAPSAKRGQLSLGAWGAVSCHGACRLSPLRCWRSGTTTCDPAAGPSRMQPPAGRCVQHTRGEAAPRMPASAPWAWRQTL